MFSSEDAETLKNQGRKVILVRVETSPEDIHGMHAAEGILTTRGGMTSHAAVVARGMGKPCVSGAGALRVDYRAQTMTAGGMTLKKGDILTIDGSTGQVLAGSVPMLEPALAGEFATLMKWADGVRKLKVRANADTPADARAAIKFGAEGIGLCRTEHMFFDEDRIRAVREMILAEDEKSRRAALAKLLPMQRADFVELFKIMGGLPVTIRLLDPPLHEFLPHTEEEIAEVARRWAPIRKSSPIAHASCTSSIRCSASAAAGSPSPIRKSPRCRRAPSSRPRSKWSARPASPVAPEIMVPLIASKSRARSGQGAHRRHGARRSPPRPRPSSNIRSAP